MNYDVAIIGCGPVGALAANLLGKQGLQVLVVEREATPYPLPRAVHLDHEMVRLFQSVDLLDQIMPDMRDTEGHLHIGADHGVIRYMGTQGKTRPFGWSNDYFFYQPELEQHLRDGLNAYPNVTVKMGFECIELDQQGDNVCLTLLHAKGVQSECARWVIGCDGARSSVRKALNVQLDDLDFEEPWLVVDAEVDGDVTFPPLSGLPEDANLQQLSVMMCDPKRPATIVPGRGNHRRWELMLLPGEDDQEMMQSDNVAKLVAPYLHNVPHKIVRAATYRFHGLVAEQWQKGNIFLAGDAAHQTPPFFGQGMCHGFRDVANLAWKMVLISQGKASLELLNSYQPERDPHVRAVISAAVGAGRYICMLDPVAAAKRDEEIRGKVARNELPTTAADLIPAINTGIVAADTAKAGVRFIQPRINEQQLLDDVTPGGWRVFVADSEQVTAIKCAINQYLPGFEFNVIAADQLPDNGALQSWLDEAKANCVIVRPDFYVFGTSNGSAESLFAKLAQTLSLTQPLSEAAG